MAASDKQQNEDTNEKQTIKTTAITLMLAINIQL